LKQLLLAGIWFLALAALGSTACATPFDFTFTGSLVTFTVPTTDTYQILAFGAQGGGSQAPFFGAGGRGAAIGGDFSLTAGENLTIAVGGAVRTSAAVVVLLWLRPVTRRWSSRAGAAAAALC
jgi:hypothetical protein